MVTDSATTISVIFGLYFWSLRMRVESSSDSNSNNCSNNNNNYDFDKYNF